MSASKQKPLMAIGLMSGTSADGVDAALVVTDGDSTFEYLDAITIPYENELRANLIRLARSDSASIPTILSVERSMTDVHIEACRKLLPKSSQMNQLAVVGFHGHTIRHLPDEDATWQIGNASLLSQSLACPVVSDFRRRDMAAGGQGAPLVPLFHRMLLASQTRPFAVLNLGGVANVTWVDENGNVTAGDTGPGCGLLDTWIESKVGQRFDLDGKLAAEGTIHIETVDKALTDPYFARPLPKSADRFDFESISVEHLSVEDGAATLCAITTTAVSQAIKTLGNPHTVWVTGGGANHPLVMSLLQNSFDSVQPVSRANLRSNSLEAECFAWLAVRRLAGLPTTLPETTGCRVPTCGGLLTI